MYRMDDMATWREHSRDLLGEAEEARLARNVKEARPQVGADLCGQGEARSGPATLHSGLGGPGTDEILAGAGWPDMIGSEDGGTADPVDRGPVIAALKKGSTWRLDRFVGREGFVR